jgi:hypothetical protein
MDAIPTEKPSPPADAIPEPSDSSNPVSFSGNPVPYISKNIPDSESNILESRREQGFVSMLAYTSGQKQTKGLHKNRFFSWQNAYTLPLL